LDRVLGKSLLNIQIEERALREVLALYRPEIDSGEELVSIELVLDYQAK
jgi:hypothetical protein